MNDGDDADAEQGAYRPHPAGADAREIIIHRHQMDPFSGQ